MKLLTILALAVAMTSLSACAHKEQHSSGGGYQSSSSSTMSHHHYSGK